MQIQHRRVAGLAAGISRPSGAAGRRFRLRALSAAAAAPTRVRYVKQPKEDKLFYWAMPLPTGVDNATNLQPDDVAVRLTDLRTDNDISIKRNGFELVRISSGQGINWEDADQVKEIFYPEVESLLSDKTGGRVHVIHHALRKGKTDRRVLETIQVPGTQDPAALTHVDFSDYSAHRTLQFHFGAEAAAELSKKPWAIIQVWRPLTGPVQDSALGFIDAATVKAQDLVAVPVHVAENFTHEVSYVVHNPDHRWYWTSQMQEDEAYIHVNFHSHYDSGPRTTPHCALVDTSVPEDAPIRQSIETRAFVFWDT